MTDKTITIGQRVLPVAPIPLGKLRKVLPAMNRIGRAFSLGQVEEGVLDELFNVLALATGLDVADIEAMPGTYPQLMEAISTVADVCGVAPKKEGGAPGEAMPGTPSPA